MLAGPAELAVGLSRLISSSPTSKSDAARERIAILERTFTRRFEDEVEFDHKYTESVSLGVMADVSLLSDGGGGPRCGVTVRFPMRSRLDSSSSKGAIFKDVTKI